MGVCFPLKTKNPNHHLEDHPRTCKCLVTPPFISHQKGNLEGEKNPYLGDFTKPSMRPFTTYPLRPSWDDPSSHRQRLPRNAPTPGTSPALVLPMKGSPYSGCWTSSGGGGDTGSNDPPTNDLHTQRLTWLRNIQPYF